MLRHLYGNISAWHAICILWSSSGDSRFILITRGFEVIIADISTQRQPIVNMDNFEII